ncbi:DUF4255 domain-containing protein [Pseudorhodoferax sp. Leaf267]|uniref:DUF4255 domain-containing protein n=1 Tax=Pseudorhodoferax sp. Leaf267 TaxID=1736316 RepID=UPI0006F649C4|nr:DUF4255 domain-containing protein [Pseudorhodoferax sp. Leaf267]KQP12279.1 hypothetical protein ASF43_22505 [Pseudorhodoferax sp. Leaf267]
MSTALAIAGVTAVLRDLLNDGLVNHNISGVLGSSVTVSLLAPDRVVPTDGPEASQINLFLYGVTPNLGWRNEALPSRDGAGRARLTNPPLALDLHYLLSAYSGGELHAEILLGYAMQLLHEMPVLTREAIRTALNPSPVVAPNLPPALRALAESGLADQVELIKLTPQHLNTEEMSKLWTATQSHLRPSVAYSASVVLIQARRPARTPLPVLTRGRVDPVTGREAGIAVQPGLVPAVPLLTAAVLPLRQPVAAIGDEVVLQGRLLDGTARSVRLVQDRLEIDVTLPVLAEQLPDRPAATVAAVSLAGQQAALPAGVYRVVVRVTRPDAQGVDQVHLTNPLMLTLAPQITNLPQQVGRAGDGSAALTIVFTPALRVGQRAVLVLGASEYAPEVAGATPTSLDFVVPDAQVGVHLARLRIDGVDSPIIDMDFEPPELPGFLDRTVEFT